MSSSHFEHDDRYQRSRSKSSRYRDDYYDDGDLRSRSRSRSKERYRHRHGRSRSRSLSRSYDYYKRHRYSSRRHRESRSYSRSRSRSHESSQRSRKHRSDSRSSHRSHKVARTKNHSRSRTPKRTDSHRHYESRKSQSRSPSRTPSAERYGNKNQKSEEIPKTNEIETCKLADQENSSTQYFSSNTDPDLENLPLPEQKDDSISNYEYYEEPQEPIDKERIHREIEEKLREALAKEGKIYPPPKPEASHPVFANDGSFLEIFKKMQEAQTSMTAAASTSAISTVAVTLPTVASTSIQAAAPSFINKPIGPTPSLVGRRRGGKILKTGVVAKPKAVAGGNDDKDFWSLYLAEVNKYKNNACELNSGNRSLLK